MRRGRFKSFAGGRQWSKPKAYYRPPSSKRNWLNYMPLWLGAVFVGLVVGVGPNLGRGSTGESQSLLSSDGERVQFGLCVWGGGTNCVVDGDTIYLHGVKIRIAGIDAPETHDFKCADEKNLGDRATVRLQQLLNGGAVSLSSIDRDEDVYGRKLRNVAVDGIDVGDVLVSDGLAHAYIGRKLPWC